MRKQKGNYGGRAVETAAIDKIRFKRLPIAGDFSHPTCSNAKNQTKDSRRPLPESIGISSLNSNFEVGGELWHLSKNHLLTSKSLKINPFI